jgi:uncharacterized membrane protein
MWYGLAVILLIAWLIGVSGLYVLGSLVHVILLVAVIALIVAVVSGRRIGSRR